MSVTTGGGDKGTTELWSTERVDKDDIRVEAYGTIDELISWIGLTKTEAADSRAFQLLEKMQKDLFRVAGQLATKGRKFDHPLEKEDHEYLKTQIESIEPELGLAGFVLPGQTSTAAHLDIARTIARRAERRIVTVIKTEKNNTLDSCLVYINRVSDLLFLLARRDEKRRSQIKDFEY